LKSIADPFLPRKIERGDLEDIRECIGCNICVSGDFTQSPIRCTQNPTMGEEFRRGWHPEHIRAKSSDAHVLVVGAGPAGLESARALGRRGYTVSLAEAPRAVGGRVKRESALPGLSAWIRVVDYRVQQIAKLDRIGTEANKVAVTVSEALPGIRAVVSDVAQAGDAVLETADDLIARTEAAGAEEAWAGKMCCESGSGRSRRDPAPETRVRRPSGATAPWWGSSRAGRRPPART
jgi:hypothetical protein